MKTIKILFAVVIVATIGFTVSAFTTPKPVITEGWFRLTDPGNPDLASSYEYVGEEQPCAGAESLCAIKGTLNTATIGEPYQSDVNNAKSASDDFDNPVENVVAFEE